MKDIKAIFLLHILRANRFVVNNGFFTYPTLGSAAKVRIVDKGNTCLFAQSSEYISRLRNLNATKQFQDSNLFTNQPLIPTIIDENM